MHILVIGANNLEEEFRQKFSNGYSFSFVAGYEESSELLNKVNVIFDYLLYRNPERFSFYKGFPNVVVFYHSVTSCLSIMQHQAGVSFGKSFFGFNGWPTMINRALLEVSVSDPTQEAKLQKICQQLDIEYLVVDDRVGMVTPRVISMIINEAFYTLQEGTATAEDINLAMKLGTNYPYGPFEWADKIGITNIYELLEAVYKDTNDERYKICPLLKKHYLKMILK